MIYLSATSSGIYFPCIVAETSDDSRMTEDKMILKEKR